MVMENLMQRVALFYEIGIKTTLIFFKHLYSVIIDKLITQIVYIYIYVSMMVEKKRST